MIPGAESLICLAMPVLISLAATPETPIPSKTVILTFDDNVRSHLTIVAPMLKEYGFGATFFVSHAWMNDTEAFLSWEEVAQLHNMGFEIGNHTWTHDGFNTPRKAARLAGELALVEQALAKAGVPKPISFAWTGNAFGPECLKVLEQAGYRLARRGMQPESPYGHLTPGPLFDPARHNALLIPTAGDAYPEWTLDQFKKVVDRIEPGQIAVLQFHGVPDIRHPWVHTPPERFREYMDYLKTGGFHVIALRDALPWVPEKPIEADPMRQVQYPSCGPGEYYWPVEVEQTRERLDDWLPNMLRHQYSIDEMIQVTALPKDDLAKRIASLPKTEKEQPEETTLLPYPGERHPRIGFLEGAIDPIRGTKLSIFPPWPDAGYGVLDLPEAIFSNLGLLYLAHTHVPTIWDDQNKQVENRDWVADGDGGYRNEWRLENGVSFGAHAIVDDDEVQFELWLENGTKAKLTGLRTQICLMLKGMPGFNEQDNDHKRFEKPLTAVQSLDGKRWILLAFDHCGRAWGNEKCPCMHSDPVLPDATPGSRVSVQGRLRFYEGDDVEREINRFLEIKPETRPERHYR